ncbi:MAG: ATP synthase F1 subunit epsilon [Acidimicrobiales bacterium]
MATLRVEVVTPERALWSGSATALMARSSEGEFTILPEHTSTVGDVVPEVLRVATDEGELRFAVHGGYFQVGPDHTDGVTLATVLAGVAELTTEIDVERAQAAKEAAEAALSALSSNPDDHAAAALARAELARAELRLRAAAR